MKGLETGKDKIQKICDELRKETLEPAKQEAREVVENAHIQASQIIKDAEKKADQFVQLAKEEIAERQKIFQSSLQIACRQGIDLLKQKIEEQLFDRELISLITQSTTDPRMIANLIESMVRSLEAKGIEEEFVALIPKDVSPRSINALIGAQILERLKNQSVSLGNFMGGVQIQLKESRITIDLSDAAMKELIAQYIRRDFREMIFSA